MKNIFFCLLLLVMVLSCQNNSIDEVEELRGVANQLKLDTNKVFLSSLQPKEEDLKELFNEGEAADSIIAYSNSRWADISKVPEDSMKPLTDDASLNIISVSKEELEAGKSNGLPEEYIQIAKYLKDEVTLYAIQYLNTDGTEQKMRSAFFKVNDNWMIIPLAYKAFNISKP